MKLKNIVLVGAVVFVAAVSLPVTARADDSPTHTDSPSENTAEAVRERVEKRKAELKIKLENNEVTRLKGRCKAAQAVLSKAKTRSEEVEKRRLAHYEKVTTRVNTLIEKLKVANQPTTDLEAAQSTVSLKVEELESSFDTYQQALSDAAAIDCVVDPEGFKASLQTARTLHAAIGKSYADLRKEIANTLLPAINDAKKGLNTSTAQEEGEGGE